MSKNFKILCTGNPNDRGVANCVRELYPNAKFLSRSSGYDFYEFDSQTENQLREDLKTHNVLINYSWVGLGVQQRILKIAHEEWVSGHVINVGSINEDNEILKLTEAEYTKDKLDLRNLSIALNNENFKTTHIVVGAFKATSKGSDPTMDPMHITNTIKWVLEQPFEVPIIGVQQSSDYVRNWIQQQKENYEIYNT